MKPPLRGRSLRRITGTAFGLFSLLLVAAGAIVAVSIVRTSRAVDDQVNHYGPSVSQANSLFTALLNQETGVRGFAFTGDAAYLEPYTDGLPAQLTAAVALRSVLPRDARLGRDLDLLLTAARAWQDDFAQPLIASTRAGDRVAVNSDLRNPQGKTLFDAVRAAFATLSTDVTAGRTAAVARLNGSLRLLGIGAGVSAVLVLVGVVTIWLGLRRQVIAPIARLAAESRIVAGGRYDHSVVGGGPAELDDLAGDVEAMRRRVVADLEQVQQAQAEAERTSSSLARSNADLEQFAYVASHDLQEPLRKVSNFCQLLERQYAAELDDRARQYIGFAVDGAKRMQILINDLLSFSRVGRNSENFAPVGIAAVIAEAVDTLSGPVAETGATVIVAPDLPTLPGDATLLTTLFQNLIGNAVKYHGEDPPRVEISAVRRPVTSSLPSSPGAQWEFCVSDNGIGIEQQYAQRIFVIFQRLHLRDSYGGTGIGLAMCKKIVEYHGGTIWLDPSPGPGARFHFTLPEGITA